MLDAKQFVDALHRRYPYLCIDGCQYIGKEAEMLLSTKYRIPLKQWFNDYVEITDITIPALDSSCQWSLKEVAQDLDELDPNIPVASVLLSLFDDAPQMISCILAVAGETCVADERFIIEENTPVCVRVTLDEDNALWLFMAQDTQPENLKKYQMWEVLLCLPKLAAFMTYDFAPGSSIQLWEDEMYHIVSPEGEAMSFS